MASDKRNFKRYWPLMVLATAMAERAHAPLMDGAKAAGLDTNWARPAAAVTHPRPPAKASSKSDMHGPSAPLHVDPEKVAKKLHELERGKPDDALALFQPDKDLGNFGSDLRSSDQTNLLQPQPQTQDQTGLADAPAGAADEPFLSGYPQPRNTVTIVYDGFGFLPPQNNPVTPEVIPHRRLIVTNSTVTTDTTTTTVPEPAVSGLLISALMLTPRRKRSA